MPAIRQIGAGLNRRQVIAAATVLCATKTAASTDAVASVPHETKWVSGGVGLIHHVLFWLKNPESQAARARLIQGLSTLAQIEAVSAIYVGVPAATAQRGVVDHSYSVSEMLFFEDVAAQNAYQGDPIHQQFVADCSHLWERLVVYDVDIR